MIQKALGFLFLFGIVPVCTGLLWTKGRKEDRRRIDYIYLAGFLTQLAVFQIIAVPVMIAKAHGMELLVDLVTGVLAALSIAGAAVAALEKCGQKSVRSEGPDADLQLRDRRADAGAGAKSPGGGMTDMLRRGKRLLASLSTECRLFWLLVLAAVAFQMYMAFTCASFDGDDSYYVVQSVLADQTGVLNRIRPYTGLSTDLDIRHALATLPLWEAYVARMTGIHATIVAHSLLPLVLIPLTYLCYFEIGRKLLGAKNIRLPIFMIFVSIMQIWGNTSIYTNATFFLTRTWQGKSVLANLVLLVQLWLLLEIFDETAVNRKGGRRVAKYSGNAVESKCDSRTSYWGLIVVNNVVSAMMTSMGAFLAAMFLGIAGLVAAIRQKKLSLLLKAAVCCVPNVIYLLLLLVLG